MTQQMTPLPTSRMMAYQPPSSFSGINFFGPLFIKLGGSTLKSWCCLFTIPNTRAVHLELVHSLDIDDFIMCFRRFINRRGKVVQLIIRSDKRYQFCGWRKRAKRKSQTVEPVSDWARSASARVQMRFSATYCFDLYGRNVSWGPKLQARLSFADVANWIKTSVKWLCSYR